MRLLHGWGFPDHQRAQLLAAADAYVAVRRGGGWDPHAAEAVALGKHPDRDGDFGSQAELVRASRSSSSTSRGLVDDPRIRDAAGPNPMRESLAAHAARRVRSARRSSRAWRARTRQRFAPRTTSTRAPIGCSTRSTSGGHVRRARDRRCARIGPPIVRAPASGQIVVLGMHRSGTSSVAGLLARMGAWPGEDSALLIGPGQSARTLRARPSCTARACAGSPPPAATGSIRRRRAPAAAVDAFRREVAAVLETLDAHRPWFIKEPRLCLLVRELLPLLTRPVFVHVVRDPLEVADSLAARDGLGRDEALALWERYTRAAFAATRGWPRVVVDYADARRRSAAPSPCGCMPISSHSASKASSTPDPVDGRRLDRARARGASAPTAERTPSSAHAQRELLAAIADRSILDARFLDETVADDARAAPKLHPRARAAKLARCCRFCAPAPRDRRRRARHALRNGPDAR